MLAAVSSIYIMFPELSLMSIIIASKLNTAHRDPSLVSLKVLEDAKRKQCLMQGKHLDLN